MRRLFAGWALVLVLAFAPQVQAENYPIRGIMTGSCSDIFRGVSEAEGPQQDAKSLAIISWAQGYISGRNVEPMLKGEPYLDLGSRTTLELWSALLGFCKRNPGSSGIAAVEHAASLLVERRHQK